MYILINEQSITITKHKVVRSTIDGHLTLTVWIPTENITPDDLFILCTTIEETAPTIKVYENEDVVETLTGFKLYPVFALSKDRTSWELSIENSSELEYQYGLLKQRADDLEKANASQALVIKSQGTTIAEQAQKIESQAQTIADQTTEIGRQGAKIIAQAEEISLLNDMLLDIVMG